jgi:predicted hotdog family 3-hydroxylacyl-ACP dehydratase
VSAFPDVAGLLPHAGAMRWLSAVVHHEATHTICRVDPRRGAAVTGDERELPAWLALEFMAQCAAAHGALCGRALGAAPGDAVAQPALLLGARRLRLYATHLDPEQELEVEARHAAGERGLVAFDCALRDPARGATLAEGRLNVYTLREGARRGEAGRGDGD